MANGGHISNAPIRSPLGAVMQSWWNADAFEPYYESTEASAFMPMIFQSFPSAYQVVADWNIDYARWLALIDGIDDNYMWYGANGSRITDYKVFGVAHVPVDPNPPFNNISIPDWVNWSANAKTWYRFLDWGLGTGAVTTITLSHMKTYFYRFNGGNLSEHPVKKVHVYIQNGGDMSKADMEPGITDFYAWLDDRGIAYEETLDATGRWLDWLCDFYEVLI